MSNLEEIKNGQFKVMGIDVSISQVLGDKIADQFLAQLSEEDMSTLMDYIQQDLFEKKYNGSLVVKEREKWNAKYTLGEMIKEEFNERVKEDISNRCKEIVATKDYQDKVDEIAQEIMDYDIEGYKVDMKERIKERMVGNITDGAVRYGGETLVSIIEEVLENKIGSASSRMY